jgi:uncharacterized protein
MGMALQRDRPGLGPVVVLRRVLILMGIGFVHSTLIWSGDILRTYAIVGLVILIMSRSNDRVLIAAAILALVGASVYKALPHGTATIASALLDSDEPSLSPYAVLVLHRLQTALKQSTALASSLQIFAIMLVGFVAGKHNILSGRVKTLSLVRFLSGAVLLCIGARVLARLSGFEWMSTVLQGMFVGASKSVYHIAQSSVYGTCILLMLRSSLGMTLIRSLANIGRMALTNYLLQSFIGVFLFYAGGLALSGRIGFTVGVVIAISVYCTEAVLSRWWLERFRFGPMEWLWRTLTYGQTQSMALVKGGPLPSVTTS